MVYEASRMLEAALRKHKISNNGISYLKMVLDPFHDAQLEVVGAPDSATGSSLVHDFRRDIQISAPLGLAEGATWDMHVAFIPLARAGKHDNCGGQARGISLVDPYQEAAYTSCEPSCVYFNGSDAGANTIPPGCFVVCKVPSQSQAGTPNTTFDPYNDDCEYQAIDFAQTICDSDVSSRMIGGAMEVHNTSSKVDLQGIQVCYKQESENPYASMYSSHFDEINTNKRQIQDGILAYKLSAPPITLAEAKPLAGVTMEASKGSLIPLTFDVHENPAKLVTQSSYVMTSSAIRDQNPTAFVNDNFFSMNHLVMSWDTAQPQAAMTMRGIFPKPTPKIKLLPYNQSGTYYSGLKANNTFTLSVRVFVEAFPKAGNPDISLVRPSPHYDSKALDAVSYLFNELLAGYPVSMNAKGDYFRSLASTFKDFGEDMTDVKKCATDVARAAVTKALVGIKSPATIKSNVARNRNRR